MTTKTTTRGQNKVAHVMASLLLATTALGAGAILVTPAMAQDARTYDIPAGPLADVLNQYARQAGVELAYHADLTGNASSPGLKGSYGLAEGLSRILAGTGITYRQTGPHAFTLEPAPTADAGTVQLGPVRVEGDSGAVAASAPSQAILGNLPPLYAGGQVATGSQLGILGNRSVMDAPFNTTSYTAKTIQDQQVTSLAGVLNNNSSVRSTFSQGSYTDIFYIRGFPVFSDDTALGGIYGVLPRELVSTDIAERVEITNGPSALLNGISPLGSVGGSINVVPKRATDDPLTEVTASYGSRATFGGHIDIGRRFGDNNEWGVRFNGTIRGGDTPVDGQTQRFGDAVLALDYRGERFRFSADLGYQNGKYNSTTQPIYLASGIPVPKAPDLSKNVFAPWSYWNSTNYFAVLRAEYDITPNWTVFAAGGGRNNIYDDTATQPVVYGADGTMTSTPYLFPAEFKSRTAQAGIRGKFDTGPIHHSVSLVGNWLNLETDSNIFLASSSIVTNLYNPDWGSLPSFAGANNSRPRVSNNELYGAALADTLSAFDERVQLTLGLRQQYVSTRNYNRTTQAVTAAYDSHATSPAVGFVVKPVKNVSLYANYIQGLQVGSTAPSTAVNAGETFAPYKTKQVEAGVKVDWGPFTTTFNAFQIKQPSAFTDPTTLIYSVIGQQRNRGLEFNTSGEVADGVRVLGGLTLMEGTLTKTSSALTQGKDAPGVPHAQLNLGGEWDTPFLRGFTLTSRVIYTSSQYYDQTNLQKLPGWTTLDLGARYKFQGPGGRPMTIRADVTNALGKDYWVEASNYGLDMGSPRTFLLSASVNF